MTSRGHWRHPRYGTIDRDLPGRWFWRLSAHLAGRRFRTLHEAVATADASGRA